MDKTIKPTVVLRVEPVLDHILKMGLSKEDLIPIIQSKTSPKVGKGDIKQIIKVIREIEQQFTKAQEEK